LRDDAADFNEKEAEWVIRRLAELLGWEAHDCGSVQAVQVPE
jgi:hypothetical protein